MKLAKGALFALGIFCLGDVFAIEKAPITEKDLPVLSQETQHKVSCKRVYRDLSEEHYRKDIKLNDEFIKNFFKKFINDVDSYHVSFLQSEVDSYLSNIKRMKDAVYGCNLSLAYEISNLSIKKRFEQYTYAIKLLESGNIDLTTSDEFQYDRSKESWPQTTSEQEDLYLNLIKFDLIKIILSGKTTDKAKAQLIKRYKSRLNFLAQTTSEDIFSSYENALSAIFDPHSNYLSPVVSEEFFNDMNLSLEGIGATLSFEDDTVTIVDLLPGGPAEKSHQLKPKDKIIGVGTSKDKLLDIVGMRLDEAVKHIRGPKGSTVYLQVQRGEGDASKIFVISIVRDKIKMADRAASSEVIKSGNKKIGVLKVSSFYNGLTRDANKELEKLNKEKVDAVVVDLRQNPGGLISEATSFTGLFIDQGPVVQTRDRAYSVDVNKDVKPGMLYKGPLLVMIDRLSASASEIFAAALQDYDRAIIVGGNSFGKGTVQQVANLARFYDLYAKDIGQLKYTIAKFYRINGGSTQLKGVAPDISFPSALDYLGIGEGELDNAMPWDSIEASKYEKNGNASSYVANLKEKHEARIKDSLDFNILIEEVERSKVIKDKKTVSLNLEERKNKQKEDEQLELSRVNRQLKEMGKPEIEKVADLPDDIKLPDVWKNEAVAIAADLVDDMKVTQAK